MGFCGGGDVPEEPDYGEQIDRANEIAQGQLDLQGDIFSQYEDWQDWAKTELAPSLAMNKDISQNQFNWAKQDRQRQSEFQKQENHLMRRADELEDPRHTMLNAARRQAEVQQSFDAQRENAVTQMASYGIDPSQMRFGAIDTDARNTMAAQQAAAANMGYEADQQRADQLRIGLAGMGQQYGQQALSGLQTAANTNQGNVNMVNAASGVGSGQLNNTAQYGNTAISANNAAGNFMTQGFQNQMTAYNAEQAASPMNALGSLAGTVGGAALDMYTGGMGTAALEAVKGTTKAAEGGVVSPQQAVPGLASPDSPTDSVPARLTPGEYVVPQDVLQWKGQEFFEKLVQKSREANAEGGTTAGQPRQALPTGGGQ